MSSAFGVATRCVLGHSDRVGSLAFSHSSVNFIRGERLHRNRPMMIRIIALQTKAGRDSHGLETGMLDGFTNRMKIGEPRLADNMMPAPDGRLLVPKHHNLNGTHTED